MFGNLFEQEEDEGFASTSSRSKSSRRTSEPPAPRGKSNLCGIKNQGGTCYLNSLLQTLLFTPEFRGQYHCLQPCGTQHTTSTPYQTRLYPAEELFGLGPEQLGHLEDKDKPGAKVSICTASGVPARRVESVYVSI